MRQNLSKRISGLNSLLKQEYSIMAILAIMVGLAGGLGAIGLPHLIKWALHDKRIP
jgi:hypothetical protein